LGANDSPIESGEKGTPDCAASSGGGTCGWKKCDADDASEADELLLVSDDAPLCGTDAPVVAGTTTYDDCATRGTSTRSAVWRRFGCGGVGNSSGGDGDDAFDDGDDDNVDMVVVAAVGAGANAVAAAAAKRGACGDTGIDSRRDSRVDTGGCGGRHCAASCECPNRGGELLPIAGCCRDCGGVVVVVVVAAAAVVVVAGCNGDGDCD
jgi:hypothetical protein